VERYTIKAELTVSSNFPVSNDQLSRMLLNVEAAVGQVSLREGGLILLPRLHLGADSVDSMSDK
jgi:hypothetical protein